MTPRGERNNNPGNLRYAESIPWVGLADPPHDDDGYCVFTAPGFGLRALGKDLLAKFKRHGLVTVRRIIDVYAPPVENNTDAYIADVAARLGTDPDSPINLGDYGQLLAFMKAIVWHECGRIIYDKDTLGQACSIALA